MPKRDPDQIVDEQEAGRSGRAHVGGTMCWTAAITGPSQASASIWPMVNSSQASHRFGREQAEREAWAR